MHVAATRLVASALCGAQHAIPRQIMPDTPIFHSESYSHSGTSPLTVQRYSHQGWLWSTTSACGVTTGDVAARGPAAGCPLPAPSAAAGVSLRICKTLALLSPACAVMGSSAGSSAARERRQSSTARIGTLKSTSQANAQSIEQHTPGIEELNLLAIAEPQGVDQELSCRELGSATRKLLTLHREILR